VNINGPLNLEDFHDIDNFTCGVSSVDQWVSDHARRNSKKSIGRVCVYTQPDSNLVVGIYAFTIRVVARENLNNKFRSCAPPDGIPAYFIGQFAVSLHMQRQGLGARMLADILKGFKFQLDNSEGFPAPFIYLDAVDEVAAKFWLKNGFRHFPQINKCTYLKSTSFLSSYVYPYDSVVTKTRTPAKDLETPLERLRVVELRALARAAGLPRLARSGRRAELLAALSAPPKPLNA
jgi:hypothetical protein